LNVIGGRIALSVPVITRSPVRIALLALAVTLPCSKAVWGQQATHKKLDTSLQHLVQQGCSGGHQSVIITTNAGYRKTMTDALRGHGRKLTAEFNSIDAVAADVDCKDLETIAKMSGAASISTNAPMEAHATRRPESKAVDTRGKKGTTTTTQAEAAGKLQVPMFQSLLGWKELRAASYLGSTATTSDNSLNSAITMLESMGLRGFAGGVGIAVIDSGIAPGPEFGNRISAFYDFTQGDVRLATPSDEYGHGSHVAGLIAGANVGVAPGAHLVGLKVLDGHGRGSTSDVLRAIEFAIANKAMLHVSVINLSLGHPIYESAATDPLVQAVERAVRAGFIVVASAGNFGINKKTGLPGYAGIASPGNAPSALTVGATQTFDTVTRDDDRVTAYSSRGPSWYDGFAKPDVVAPGDNILSVAAAGSRLRAAQELRGNVGEYMRLSGTSMAAGVTSGMVALLLEINPTLTPNALKAVAEYSAIPVRTDTGARADALTQGSGGINGSGSATLAWMINADALVGKRWLNTNYLNPNTVVGDKAYAWTQAIIWGNHIVSGATLLAEQRPAWELSTVWGAGFYNDDNIVWGNGLNDDNIVWGNNFDLGDNIVWGNNIVWGASDDNIVWGNGLNDDNIVWGNNIVWGDSLIGLNLDDNIVWGNHLDDDNIVWGNLNDDNIVWGNLFDDGEVAGENDDDNIVWGNSVAQSSTSSTAGGKR
jgi:serine protease AprX